MEISMEIQSFITQEERRAFKTAPAEDIYSALSEVKDDKDHLFYILELVSKNHVFQHFTGTISSFLLSRVSILQLVQTLPSLRRVLSTGVLPLTPRSSTSSWQIRDIARFPSIKSSECLQTKLTVTSKIIFYSVMLILVEYNS